MDKSESEMCMCTCTCSSTHLTEKVIGSYPKHNTHPLKIEISAPMEGMVARERGKQKGRPQGALFAHYSPQIFKGASNSNRFG